MSECVSQPHGQPVQSCDTGRTLENLAPELRIEIMKSLEDAVSLRSLVLASRSFYDTYLHTRRTIFKSIVRKNLDSRLWPDIQALAETKSFSAQGTRTPSEVVALIDRYSSSRQAKTDMDLDSLSLQEICELYRAHARMTRVLEDFFSSVSSKMPKSGPLSNDERSRIYQALYRLQVFHNLTNDRSKIEGPKLSLDRFGRNPYPHEGFVPSFLVWEGDAMACICEYLQLRWLKLLQECTIGASEEQRVRPHLERGGYNILRIIHSFSGAEELQSYTPPPTTIPPYSTYHHRLTSLGPEYLGNFLAKDMARRCEDLLGVAWTTHRAWFFPTHHRISYQSPRRPNLVVPAATKPHEAENIQARLLQITLDERPSAGWMWFALKHKLLSTNLEDDEYFNWLLTSDAIWRGPGRETFTEDAKHELRWGFPFWGIERLRAFGIL